MQKIGFELLKTRPLSDKIDILEFENSNKIQLPPLYKVFIQSFYIGKNLIISEQFLKPQLGFNVDLMTMRYEPDDKNILLYDLFGLEDISNVYNNLFMGDEEIKQTQLLPIGECGMNYLLMLGLGTDNSDKIFLERPDMKPRFIDVTNNIFDFVRGLILEEDKYGNISNYKFSQLYKNWGEDFWRVRE